MSISSPGIGSNLDINGILKQLMTVEAQPLTTLDKKEASYQAKLSAFGNLNSALGSFQSAVNSLNSATKFQSLTATAADATIVKATTTSQAVPGSYNLNVTQLAQAQTIMSAGQSSAISAIGTGTLTFQFGTISGGNFVSAGAKLGSSVAANGIAANSLSINGTMIATGSSTTSANALAAQINLATATTGVTATAQTTDTVALGAFTTTSGAATYTLDVGGVNIITDGAVGTTAADIDARLADATVATNLTDAGITFSGTAAAGTLKFMKTDGTNIAVRESGADAVGGFTTSIGIGTTKTFTSSVSLSSAAAITVGGGNPSAAGFTTGILPNTYTDASFTQDSSQSSGSVTIDGTNNTLQGIRDAINKANLGVTASIISDGSATPNHLVLTSSKTGLASSMKITVSGDAALADLLAYDPAGVQKMTQSSVAQNTTLTVNGIAVNSATNTVMEAIQGVSLNVSKVGSTNLSVARDTASATAGVNGLIKAYNDINKTLKELTAYNPDTRQAGMLIGDTTVRSIQAGIRQVLSASIPGLSGGIQTLSDIGVAFQKDGSLSLESSVKLQNAVTNNFNDVAGLFAAMGTTTDSLVNFSSSTSATKPGKYAVNITTLASHGKVTGATTPNLTITAGVNDQLTMMVDGVSASVTLVAGTYTVKSLVSQVQSAINGASTFSNAGIRVTASANDSNIITIESNRYGSVSDVIAAGNGATDLLGSARTSLRGVDVAGTIGGIIATGSGQTLAGTKGSSTEGLTLQITGGTTGDRGNVNFSQGYAFQLNQFLGTYLGSSGLISGRTDGINSSIKNLDQQRNAINTRLLATEKRYRAQFVALDAAISRMSKTSSFLQQQLSNLPKIE